MAETYENYSKEKIDAKVKEYSTTLDSYFDKLDPTNKEHNEKIFDLENPPLSLPTHSPTNSVAIDTVAYSAIKETIGKELFPDSEEFQEYLAAEASNSFMTALKAAAAAEKESSNFPQQILDGNTQLSTLSFKVIQNGNAYTKIEVSSGNTILFTFDLAPIEKEHQDNKEKQIEDFSKKRKAELIAEGRKAAWSYIATICNKDTSKLLEAVPDDPNENLTITNKGQNYLITITLDPEDPTKFTAVAQNTQTPPRTDNADSTKQFIDQFNDACRNPRSLSELALSSDKQWFVIPTSSPAATTESPEPAGGEPAPAAAGGTEPAAAPKTPAAPPETPEQTELGTQLTAFNKTNQTGIEIKNGRFVFNMPDGTEKIEPPLAAVEPVERSFKATPKYQAGLAKILDSTEPDAKKALQIKEYVYQSLWDIIHRDGSNKDNHHKVAGGDKAKFETSNADLFDAITQLQLDIEGFDENAKAETATKAASEIVSGAVEKAGATPAAAIEKAKKAGADTGKILKAIKEKKALEASLVNQEFPKANEDFEIRDEKIQKFNSLPIDLEKSEWEKNWEQLDPAKKKIITEVLTNEPFTKTVEDVPKIVDEIVGLSDSFNFADVLKATGGFPLKNETSTSESDFIAEYQRLVARLSWWDKNQELSGYKAYRANVVKKLEKLQAIYAGAMQLMDAISGMKFAEDVPTVAVAPTADTPTPAPAADDGDDEVADDRRETHTTTGATGNGTVAAAEEDDDDDEEDAEDDEDKDDEETDNDAVAPAGDEQDEKSKELPVKKFLADINKTFELRDKRIANFSDKEWLNNYKFIDGHETINHVLLTTFNVPDETRASNIIKEIVQIGSNKSLDFGDILKVTGAYQLPENPQFDHSESLITNSNVENFQAEYIYLYSKMAIDEEITDQEKERLKYLRRIYLGAMEILNAISQPYIYQAPEIDEEEKAVYADSNKYHDALYNGLRDQRKKIDGISYGSDVRPDERSARLNEETETEFTRAEDLDDYGSVEALAARIFASPKVKIKADNGAITELEIYKFEKGKRVINQANLTIYYNYLIAQGVKREDLKKAHAEGSYNFDEIADEEFTIGKESGDLEYNEGQQKTLEDFAKLPENTTDADLLRAWTQIQGNEAVTEALLGLPFLLDNMTTVVKEMRKFLAANKDKFTLENLFNSSFLNNILYAPIHGGDVNSYQNFSNEFSTIQETIAALRAKENLTENEKTELLLNESKYAELKTYMDPLVILARRIEKLSKVASPSAEEQIADATIYVSKIDDPEGFTEPQLELIKSGWILEQETGKQRQDLESSEIPAENLSQYPLIAKAQTEALKLGYPAKDLPQIERKLLGGAFANIKGNQIESVGAIAPVDLGHGVSAALVLSTAPQAGVGVSLSLYKNETQEGSVATGASVSPEGPSVFLGYIHKTAITDTLDLSPAIGIMLSGTGIGAHLGVALEYNQERATWSEYQSARTNQQLTEIDKITNPKAKAEALKRHPQFKELDGKLDNEDLLAVYTIWQKMDTLTSFEAGKPPIPITALGIGVGFPPPGGFLGIRIQIGTTVVFRPQLGERARLAKEFSRYQLNQKLAESSGSGIQVYTEDSPDLFLNKDGRYALLDNRAQAKLEPKSNLEALNKTLSDAQIEAKKAENGVLELEILDTQRKDISIYIDPNVEKLGVIVNEKTGQIFIPGTPNLVVTRESFHYPYELDSHGTAGTDIIVITTPENLKTFDRRSAQNDSAYVINKYWMQDGDVAGSSKWRVEKGANPEGETTIRLAQNLPESLTPATSEAEKYQEAILGISKKDWERNRKNVEDLRKILGGQSKEAIEAQTIRGENIQEWKNHVDAAYTTLVKNGLKKGKPEISDPEGVIAAGNKYFTNLNPKQPAMNDKEAGSFYAEIQHRYFVDLWKSGKKDAIKKAFESHNDYLVNKVFAPAFAEKIQKLRPEISQAEGKKHAKRLANLLKDAAETNFLEALKTLPADNADTALLTLINGNPIPEGMQAYVGTTIRSTNKGVLSQMLSGQVKHDGSYTTMGLIGAPKSWDLYLGNQDEKDLARLMLEVASPVPDIQDWTTFESPLALKLATSDSTPYFIGESNYATLTSFYTELRAAKTPEARAAVAAKSEFKTALEEFVKFANEVRAKQTGPEITSQNGYLTAPAPNQNIKLFVHKPKLASGAYGKCGNITIMAGEKFQTVGEQAGGKAVFLESDIYADTRVTLETKEIAIGVSLEGKEKDQKSKDNEPRKANDRTEMKPANPDSKPATAPPTDLAAPNPSS